MKISTPAIWRSAAACISRAELIRVSLTVSGILRLTGPAITATSAPASTAAWATAAPICPELRLLIKRTGSMASRVGPAVTSRRAPFSSLVAKDSAIAASSASGSSMRPGPVSPQA